MANLFGWPFCKLPPPPPRDHSFLWVLYDQDDAFNANQAIALKHLALERTKAKCRTVDPPWTQEEKQFVRDLKSPFVSNPTMMLALQKAGLLGR